jgi:uncharacterized membrane protein YjdF
MNIGKTIGAVLIGICLLGSLAAEDQATQLWFAVIFGGSGALLFLSSAR